MKEDKPCWKKAKPVERIYIKYDPNNNLATNEYILHNQIEKEFKSLASDICVTYEAYQNLTTSHKDLLQWHFRLGHIGFQHVQWLVFTRCLKVQVNSKAVANF